MPEDIDEQMVSRAADRVAVKRVVELALRDRRWLLCYLLKRYLRIL
jgi:hypothetical protein